MDTIQRKEGGLRPPSFLIIIFIVKSNIKYETPDLAIRGVAMPQRGFSTTLDVYGCLLIQCTHNTNRLVLAAG